MGVYNTDPGFNNPAANDFSLKSTAGIFNTCPGFMLTATTDPLSWGPLPVGTAPTDRLPSTLPFEYPPAGATAVTRTHSFTLRVSLARARLTDAAAPTTGATAATNAATGSPGATTTGALKGAQTTGATGSASPTTSGTT